MVNQLYYGDNLAIMGDHISDQSVDLIYLDPPFNSNASYNMLFKNAKGKDSAAQIEAFDDTWQWNDLVSGAAVAAVKNSNYQNAAAMLDSMVRFLGHNSMTAYLAMMAVRLIELHRVLKFTGSLYLHCDPTASHYLKILLDTVFGAKNFRNEIIWQRGTSSGGKAGGNKSVPNHDSIFHYVKSNNFYYQRQYIPYTKKYIKKRFVYFDKTGRQYRKQLKGRRQYLNESKGKPVSDIWIDIFPVNPNSAERLGYPTQKPVTLLERIIKSSSNEGDIVLDPFCGCGTTVHAAENLNRRWIGIDVTSIAISLIETRLFDAFEDAAKFNVIGVPKDVDGARELFNRDDSTKKEFEKWACSLIRSYPQGGGKKVADGGIDGIFWFGKNNRYKALVSVKGGKVGVAMVRELDAVIKKENAAIGIFLTLEKPTKPMHNYVNSAGLFEDKDYPEKKYRDCKLLPLKKLLNAVIGRLHCH